MTRDSLKKMITHSGLMVFFLLVVAACGEVSCPGGEDTGSCLRIENIEPTYLEKPTSSVDAVADLCSTGTSTSATVEKFTGHAAKISFSNFPVEGGSVPAEEISPITLGDFSITYSLNNCPAGAICPPLNTFITAATAHPDTIIVPANGKITVTYPFVDLSKKFEFVAKRLGQATFSYLDFFPPPSAPPFSIAPFLEFPSYTATYKFNGTDTFGNKVSVTGSREFTIGDFANCS
jgi:hypothetical protein